MPGRVFMHASESAGGPSPPSSSLRNFAWLLTEHGARLVAGLLITAWVARHLGPGDFGAFSLVVAGFAIIATLARMGFENILIREFVRAPAHAAGFLATALTVRLAVGVVIVATIFLASRVLRDGGGWISGLAILSWGLLPGAFEVLGYHFLSLNQSRFPALARIIQLSVSATVRIWLIFSGAGVEAFLYALVFDEVVLAVVTLCLYRHHCAGWPGLATQAPRVRHLLRESWPLALSGLAVMLYMRIDQLMIGVLLDTPSVGIYSAGVRVVEGVYFLPMLAAMAFYPAIIRAKERSQALYEVQTGRLMSLCIWGGVAVAFALAAGADWLVVLLFGDGYSGAAPVLRVQALNVVFLSMGAVAGKWLYVEGKQTLHLTKTLIGLLLNVALNLWLIPAYGAVGAAWAAVIAQAVVYFGVFALFEASRPVFFMQLRALSPVPAARWLLDRWRYRS